MRTSVLVLLAIALAGIFLLWPDDSPATAGTGLAGNEPPTVSAPAKSLVDAVSHRRETAAGKVVLRGRCVAAESGQPLAAVAVVVTSRRGRGARVAPTWTKLERTTGPDGRFALEFVLATQHSFSVSLEAVHRERFVTTIRDRARSEIDLGDIRLGVATTVRGIVVDEDNAPVAGVSVRMSWSLGIPGATVMSRAHSAQSRADGTFELRNPVPAGDYEVGVGLGYELTGPKHFEVEPGQAEAYLRVRISGSESSTIRGTIVDEAGTPLSGIAIGAYGDNRSGQTTSGSDGSFVIRGRRWEQGWEEPASLRVESSAGFDIPEPLECQWGAKDLVIRLRRSGHVELIVVEEASQKPVERYAIRVVPEPSAFGGYSLSRGRVRCAGNHEGGKLTVQDVNSGPNILIVLPEDKRLVPSEEVVFEMPVRGSARVRVELKTAVSVPVRVVTSDGKPVAGSKVEIVECQRRARGSTPLQKVEPSAMALSKREMYDRGMGPGILWLLASAMTGRDGSAVLRCAASGDVRAVRALGPGHAPIVRDGVVITRAPTPIRLVVEAGAILRGRIVPETFRDQVLDVPRSLYPQLRLVEVADPPRQLPGLGKTWRVRGDGTFELSDLPPGRWQVFLSISNSSGTVGVATYQPGPVATVTLASGKPTEIVIDGTKLTPGTIRGLVRCNGRPVANTGLYLAYGRPGPSGLVSDGGWMNVKTDARGTFEATDKPPMHYRVALSPGDGRRTWGYIKISDSFQLTSGGTVDRTFDFEAWSAKLRILAADGKTPLANAQVTIELAGDRGSVGGLTDANGWLAIPFLPAGRHSLTVHPVSWNTARAKRTTLDEWQRTAVTLDPIAINAREDAQVLVRNLPRR